jgi:superfamily II DNA helicase RecQ
MPFKFFLIPIRHSEAAEQELNAFIRSHRVLDVQRQWVESGGSPCWSFCVEYVDTPVGGGNPSQPPERRARVDYREVLNEDDFTVFATLRELRRELAQAERIPAYQVFNDRQLAEMVQKKAHSKADLQSLPGAGEARVEKYGERFLERLRELQGGQDEADGKSV